jgi:hypothetical protein
MASENMIMDHRVPTPPPFSYAREDRYESFEPGNQLPTGIGEQFS